VKSSASRAFVDSGSLRLYDARDGRDSRQRRATQARAAQDAADAGQNVAKFLGHTDDGKTARRHYLNRGVDVLTPNPRIRQR
jgi:hypothetical protein